MALIKNKLKKESNYIDNCDEKSLSAEYVSETLSQIEYDYYTSSFYKEKMDVDSLKNLLLKRNWSESKELKEKENTIVKKMRFMSKIGVNSFWGFMLGAIVKSVIFVGEMSSLTKLEEIANVVILLTLLGIFVSGFSIYFLEKVEKYVIQNFQEKEVLLDKGIYDKEGDPIKVIWFLYHNLNFKSEVERMRFLVKNYDDLNCEMKIGFDNCSSVEKRLEKYFENGLLTWEKKLNKREKIEVCF